MAGTASELYASNDDRSSDIYGFELFSCWLFGKMNAKCILLDIDQEGCSFLIPRSQIVPSGEFKIIIMSPEDEKRVHTIINARQHRVDSDFSGRHKKINCSFISIDAGTCGEINILKAFLGNHYERYIKCSILKC